MIEYSAFSDPIYRNQIILNRVNGLFGVETVMTKLAAPQSICDQSTIALLTLIHDTARYGIINSELPPGYNSSLEIRVADCSRSRSYGLQLMRAVDLYQKDCWSMCMSSGLAGFRKALGQPFDADLDNGEESGVSPYSRGISNVLTRLLTCDESGWFERNISAATYNQKVRPRW